MVKPTPEEARNGWTEETLTAYIEERQRQQLEAADPKHPRRRVRPMTANGAYNPLKWGR
jgi:hypothetical protein